MYKSFVLKHVVEPPKLLFASFNATIISLLAWFFMVMMVILFRLPFIKYFLVATILFFVLHGYMIFRSNQDPYFINVIMAKLRCRKTKNIIRTKDNLYGS